MKKRTARAIHAEQTDYVDGELSELGEECARVLLLLQRLARTRAQGRDTSEVRGELSAIVTHLHVHTKGLDELIDNLPSE
jgi:hypothetical protein